MRWRLAALLGIAALLVVTGAVRQRVVVGQTANPRLATTLADLAAAIPQEREDARPTPTPSPAAVTPLAIASLPQTVRDAVKSRRLRLSELNEVQVYVLVTDPTPDNLKRLEAAGARLEIVDEAGRRVQAEIPV